MTASEAIRSTVADVDLDAIASNVEAIHTRSKAEVIAVVKADAYGHGAEAVAETCFEAGAVMVAVATIEEGLALREGGVNGPILVLLGSTESSEVAHAVAQELVLVVWDVERARAISEAAGALRRITRVHFKVDTGLTRLGAPTNEAAARYRSIASLPHLEIEGIFTHFATADDPDPSNDRAQLGRFRDVLTSIPDRPRLVHAAASAGVAAFGPVEGMNAVRTGLAIYGLHAARTSQGRCRSVPPSRGGRACIASRAFPLARGCRTATSTGFPAMAGSQRCRSGTAMDCPAWRGNAAPSCFAVNGCRSRAASAWIW